MLCLKQREREKQEILQTSLLCYRTTPNSTAEALMERKLRNAVDALRPKEQQKQGMCLNKDRPLSVGTAVFVRSYRPGQPNWTPGITHKKERFIYSVQVGDQFWARHRNQLRPRYTSNTTTNNTSDIPLDLLVDTFELPATSPVERQI